MAQNEILHDFSSFNSVEEGGFFFPKFDKKALRAFTDILLANPTSQILCHHTQLMRHIYNSNFYKILSLECSCFY